MTLENTISHAFAQPHDAISYDVSQQLNALYPDKYILLGDACPFGLNQFVEAERCRAALNPDILNQIVTQFKGIGRGLERSISNGAYDIEWQDKILQAVFVSWREGFQTVQQCWLVAETQAVAEDFYLQVCEWAAEVRGEVLVFDGGGWSKSSQLFKAIKDATFENLVLPARLKQEIQDDFAQFFASRELYESYRIPWKRGVLLIGPPGNGKTHTVKSLINWLDVPCLYVKSFKAERMTDQDNIRKVFQRARQTTPCVLVLEDLDSLIDGKNRSFFLNELDGFASNTGIVVLATTNHPERLDTAIVNRPSRFDRKYHFELPADAERENYIRAWNSTVENELQLSDADIADIVALTGDFSFAYMKELFLSALMRWIANGRSQNMAAVMREQCGMLREQMSSAAEAPEIIETDDDEGGELAKMMRRFRF